MTLKRRQRLCLLAAIGSFFVSQSVLGAADLNEPITIASENGMLNILMVAKAAPINILTDAAPGGKAPAGWVYQICKRPIDGTDFCPLGRGETPNYHGGTLL